MPFPHFTQPERLIAELGEVLRYEPDTGRLVWMVMKSSKTPAGSVAGHLNRIGYREIRVNGQLHLAHRLAWALHHGSFPDETIDHINGNRDDNRIANLRLASFAQNNWNRGVNRNNRAGAKGVFWHAASGKWAASICKHRVRKHLGLFETKEAAALAYEQAATELHGEFASVRK